MILKTRTLKLLSVIILLIIAVLIGRMHTLYFVEPEQRIELVAMILNAKIDQFLTQTDFGTIQSNSHDEEKDQISADEADVITKIGFEIKLIRVRHSKGSGGLYSLYYSVQSRETGHISILEIYFRDSEFDRLGLTPSRMSIRSNEEGQLKMLEQNLALHLQESLEYDLSCIRQLRTLKANACHLNQRLQN